MSEQPGHVGISNSWSDGKDCDIVAELELAVQRAQANIGFNPPTIRPALDFLSPFPLNFTTDAD